MSKTLKLEDFKANTKEWFLEQLGNMSAPQALQTISDLYDELHKPTYPKTYEVCWKVFDLKHNLSLWWNAYDAHSGIVSKLPKELLGIKERIESLSKLLVCRNVYWKLYGEEIGLDGSWEPDYDSGVNKYGIIYMNGVVQKSNPTTNWERHLNKVLDFPTEEMRDTFFENFKDLIEQCKELL